jgi:hypothetical protein
MRFASNAWAIGSLIISNLVPLYGAYFLGWNVFSILLIYWCESAIIGYFTLLKLGKVELLPGSNGAFGNNKSSAERLFKSIFKNAFAVFFMMHYTTFMSVHLSFLFFFFRSDVSYLALVFSCISLFISHYVSYRTNFIGNQEYKKTSAPLLLFSPYPRILIMHLTVIIGAGIATASGSPQTALAVLVGIKIAVDLLTHLNQHRFTVRSSLTSEQHDPILIT